MRTAAFAASLILAAGCAAKESPPGASSAGPPAYLDSSARPDRLSGGARRIPVTTPKGTFEVWTKRVGNNPRIRVLLLHGGPGLTHEYFEAFDSFLPAAGIEYYFYDQLGSAFSDQPDEPELWEIPRFVDEVEQVRAALGLGPENFYLFGHSWGGMLALEYALAHPDRLKGLVISNMMSSIPAYNEYARNVLMPAMDPAVLAEVLALEAAGDWANPRYEELLFPSFYVEHVLRMPLERWPEPVLRCFSRLNKKIYVPMQGPSEMSASGKLVDWNRTEDLAKLAVPTLVIGAAHDTMDPKFMEAMARKIPKGRYLFCPDGSHLALYDDQERYMAGLVQFLRDVDAGRL